MNGDIVRNELQRERWRQARAPLRLVDPETDDFGVGGLARHVGDIGVRLLIMPSDPSALVVDFDQNLWEWWMQNQVNPFEGAAPTDWGMQSTPTVDAAVRFSQRDGKWSWASYTALHRSGALEVGFGEVGFGTGRRRDGKIHRGFYLSKIVGRTWGALSLYETVITHYPLVQAPWEVTLALSQTKDAELGNVAAGWIDFGGWFPRDAPRCPEDNILLRLEVEEWPKDDGVRDLAFDFGDMIEDAWGIKERRFLIAEEHDGAGTFDVSRYS